MVSLIFMVLTKCVFFCHLFCVLYYNTFKYCLYVSFSILTLLSNDFTCDLFFSLSHFFFTLTLFIFNNSFTRILFDEKRISDLHNAFHMHTNTLRARGKKHPNELFQCLMCVCEWLPACLHYMHCICFFLSSCKLKC